jgi:hypothetical protein
MLGDLAEFAGFVDGGLRSVNNYLGIGPGRRTRK